MHTLSVVGACMHMHVFTRIYSHHFSISPSNVTQSYSTRLIFVESSLVHILQFHLANIVAY